MRQLPGVVLQWEDFSQANARRLLDRYRDQLCTFNDDIQGTGAVALGALLTAVRCTGGRLADQRFVLAGAGSAGTGVCDLIVAALRQDGLTRDEAHARLWLVSSRGLLHRGVPNLTPGQEPYCQPSERVASWRPDAGGNIPLLEVVERVRPTALIGVCGQPGLFTESIVRAMARLVQRPIVLPLSNPTSRSEAAPADLAVWTEGHALIATGSPFSDVSYRGRTITVSQCNNVYIFPGLGHGVIAAQARRVTDEMFLAAARALSTYPGAAEGADAPLLPPLAQIRTVSRCVALAVGREAQRQGLARPMAPEEWEQTLSSRGWEPKYPLLRYQA
jgi:malate dehydrogenase (oxaloacetate-decarboxylating)